MSRENKGTKELGYFSYIFGFTLSVLLTLAAYFAVTRAWLSGKGLLLALGVLAIVQFLAQMVFFLHLGREARPRWKLTVFVFMVTVVIIIVFGSLWIMTSLDYHHMDSHESSDEYIIKDEGYSQ